VQITVTAPAQPDLSEYVAVDKTTVATGGSLTVDAYNMNLGNATVGPSTAQIYLSADATITASDTALATVVDLDDARDGGPARLFRSPDPHRGTAGESGAGNLLHRRSRRLQQPDQREQRKQYAYNVVQITVAAAASLLQGLFNPL
jgi:hypothetical protein